MPLNYPDIIQHNNPNLAVADSDFVRGGARVVANLTALYALSSKTDQLKVRVTKVWVTAESAYYILIDIANVGNSSGWTVESLNIITGVTPSGVINGVNDTFTPPDIMQIDSESVYVNGLKQKKGPGYDYTTSGNNLIFVSGNIPVSGDTILMDYLK